MAEPEQDDASGTGTSRPGVGRRRDLGAAGVGAARGGPDPRGDDHALKRAAEGVEIERRVAETLQRSLLPKLPAVPGLRLAARYRPGSAETRIGGDWYDAIPLRGGKVGIAIGDVVGRGVKAAARMAHLQSALRAYALEALRPQLVLERMNSFVLEGEQGGMVTLLYAIVDPDAAHGPGRERRPPAAAGPATRTADPTFAEAPAGSPMGVNALSLLRGEHRDAGPVVDRAAVHGRAGRGPGAAAGRRGSTACGTPPRTGRASPRGCARRCSPRSTSRAGSRDDLALLAIQLTPPGKTLALALPGRRRRWPRCGGRSRSGCGCRGPARRRSTRCWSPAARRAPTRWPTPIPPSPTRRSRSARERRGPRDRDHGP